MVGILNLLGVTIQPYVWVGILLIIIGLLIAVFIPLVGQKIGVIMVILGLVLSVGFTMVANLFENTTFVSILIGSIAFVTILWILFPQNMKVIGKK